MAIARSSGGIKSYQPAARGCSPQHEVLFTQASPRRPSSWLSPRLWAAQSLASSRPPCSLGSWPLQLLSLLQEEGPVPTPVRTATSRGAVRRDAR